MLGVEIFQAAWLEQKKTKPKQNNTTNPPKPITVCQRLKRFFFLFFFSFLFSPPPLPPLFFSLNHRSTRRGFSNNQLMTRPPDNSRSRYTPLDFRVALVILIALSLVPVLGCGVRYALHSSGSRPGPLSPARLAGPAHVSDPAAGARSGIGTEGSRFAIPGTLGNGRETRRLV